MPVASIDALPVPVDADPAPLALIITHMQRDLLEPGGFGEALGNDVSRLREIVPACAALLVGLRELRVPIVHTRKGHRSDLSDAPRAKIERRAPLYASGMGWALCRR
jgi:biuret amidohydrolase